MGYLANTFHLHIVKKQQKKQPHTHNNTPQHHPKKPPCPQKNKTQTKPIKQKRKGTNNFFCINIKALIPFPYLTQIFNFFSFNVIN